MGMSKELSLLIDLYIDRRSKMFRTTEKLEKLPNSEPSGSFIYFKG